MSAIIDDKVVAGAQDPVVKEDPIVSLTVKFISLEKNISFGLALNQVL